MTATGTLSGPGSTTSNTLSFTVTFGAASQIVLSGSTSNLASGSTRQLTATIEDAAGNTVTSGADSTDSITFAKTSGTGTVSGLTTVAANAGIATDTVTGVLAGSVSIQANGTLNGSAKTSNTLTFTVVPGPADATQSSLTPTSASITANGSATKVLTVQAKDANGNNLTTGGATVTIIRQSGTGSIGSVTDNGDGTYTATVTAPTATGNGIFVATLGGNPVKSGTGSQTQATVTYVPGPATKLAFTTSPSGTITGGTAFPTQPVVTVQDQFGNTVTSDTSSITLAITGGTGTSGASLACTANPTAAASGVAAFAGCKIDKSGTGYTLTATDGSLTSAVSNPFTVGVGSAVGFTVSGYPSPSTAGASHNFTVTAIDAGGNTVTGYTGTVKFTSSDPQASLPSNSTLTSGAGTFSATLKTAGTRSITATDTVNSSITGSQTGITVNAAPASVLAFVNCSMPSNNSTCSGQPISVGNNSDMTFNMQRQDAFGNPSAPTSSFTITFTNSDSTFTITAGAPGDDRYVVGD